MFQDVLDMPIIRHDDPPVQRADYADYGDKTALRDLANCRKLRCDT